MNICLVITGLTMGGAERQVCDLADQFAALGHEVKLISLNQDPVVLPQSPAIQVCHLYLKKNLPGLFSGFFRLRREIRGFKPDVVHAHMVHANILCRLLRLITPMNTLICTAHNTNEGGKLRELAYRYTDWLSTISTNVTQEAVDTYIGKRLSFPNRMIAVANGIDETQFQFAEKNRTSLRDTLNIASDCFLFLSVGRLEEQKDFVNLITAFSLLKTREPDQLCHLAVIGDGALRCDLEQLVDRLKLNEDIVFLGSQFNVNEWMSACDAYVLSSAWEGFGLVVAEAMLCERVVVATDSGGVKEVVSQQGFLVPPKSSDRLAQEMHKVMHLESDVRASLGRSGRKHIVSQYSLASIAEKWITIYTSF